MGIGSPTTTGRFSCTACWICSPSRTPISSLNLNLSGSVGAPVGFPVYLNHLDSTPGHPRHGRQRLGSGASRPCATARPPIHTRIHLPGRVAEITDPLLALLLATTLGLLDRSASVCSDRSRRRFGLRRGVAVN